jgi:hypothetical protein
VFCVSADDVVEGDRPRWCSPTAAACNARVREIQRINRAARRHLYEGIGECAAIESDPDGDGIHLDLDLCPTTAGLSATHGCPDGDGDGTADRTDRCPEVAGPVMGCPDADDDGIHDGMDDCPAEPGPAWRTGCPAPPDTDGDGIEDGADVCPQAAGSVGTWGCPDADSDRVPDVCFDTARALAMPIYAVDAEALRMFVAMSSSSCDAGWYSDRCRNSPEDYEGEAATDPTRMDGCPRRR